MTNQSRKNSRPSTPEPLIPLRTLAILTASVLIGVLVAAVTYVRWHQITEALVIGAISALGAARQLQSWTGT